jgi:hypothetical protein
MSLLIPPASGVTIRMYKQGLGDCFLLAFPTEQPGQAYYMLIDCGVVLGTPDPQTIMTRVVNDIKDATGGDIHLLVATHEHWDHLSGFLQAGAVFNSMRIHNLWLAWTENPDDQLANQLRGEFTQNLTALRAAVNSASNPVAVQHITNLVQFFGNPTATAATGNGASSDGTDSAGAGNTGDALQKLRAFVAKMQATAQYRYPLKDPPLSLPSVNGLPNVPDIRLYVLGPPYDEQKLKDILPTTKGQETYKVPASGSALTALTTLLTSVVNQDQLSPQDRVLRERRLPFDQSVRIPPAEAKEDPFFQTYYGFDEESAASSDGNTARNSQSQDSSAWRRIDDDYWLGAGAELALKMDSYTNNTSLALAIELVDSNKVLLFAADAQIGNWLSWDDLSWTLPDAQGNTQTIHIADLLARTVLYKVGHHGSFNATIRGLGTVPKGLELMTSPDLVAMVPVDHQMALKKHWGQMPFDPLLQRLRQKANFRVMRSHDDPFPLPKPDGMDDAIWEAFKANYEESDLYMQYMVHE